MFRRPGFEESLRHWTNRSNLDDVLATDAAQIPKSIWAYSKKPKLFWHPKLIWHFT